MDKKRYSNSEILLGDLRGSIRMAHTHVFHSYADELNSYMAVICGNSAMAEDIVQETFVKFWDKRKKLAIKDLTPNQKANASATDAAFLIETIDIKDHLGWTTGDLVFYKDNMATLFKKLVRKITIRIENNYPKLESLSFSGRF